MLSMLVSPPLFFVPFPYVILDIPEVPAFKKRAQVFGGGSLYNECFPFDLKSAIIEYRVTPPHPPSGVHTYGQYLPLISNSSHYSIYFTPLSQN